MGNGGQGESVESEGRKIRSLYVIYLYEDRTMKLVEIILSRYERGEEE
jgi:hypothetical protein